ncbi:hypothetical protein D9M70_632860 [compost metagenome]
MAVSSSVLGMMPASDSGVALTITMKRIVVLLVDGPGPCPLAVLIGRWAAHSVDSEGEKNSQAGAGSA